MKSALKTALRRAGAYEHLSSRWIWLSPRVTRAIRAISGKNQRLAGRYFADYASPKLHIGCGGNDLPGWLNTELDPKRDQIYLDATKPFPFPSDTFDYIYSEHMIEHVPWSGARVMLGECFRVLKPNAAIRLVTPNLGLLTRLLAERRTELEEAYLEYSVREYRLPASRSRAVHVVNNFVRAWGHQFIYDSASLHELVAEAGFVDLVTPALMSSTHPELCNLAISERMPTGFLDLESIVVEARKPART